MIAKNELIQYDHQGQSITERILFIDEANDTVVAINISLQSLPVSKTLSEVLQSLRNGEMRKISDDPWIRIVDETSLSDKEKQIRARAWEIIGPMFTSDNEPYLYDPIMRGKLVRDTMNRCGVAKMSIYRLLKRYWHRGMTMNAFLPDYDNSGGRGKRKTKGDKKLGRPRKYPSIIGGEIDEKTRKIMDVCIVRFLLKKGKKVKIKDAYDMMMLNYFTGENAQLDYDEIIKAPTLDQFTKYFRNEFKISQVTRAREGETNYAQNFRAITGTSQQNTYGPGHRFQIDATVADIYLLAEADRKSIIGRPVLYIVQDVFSRMVTGMYVGLEGPSWIGAMMALANTATDKVAFCADCDIAIKHEQWPSRHLPETILADRGELEGYNVESLIYGLHVVVENTAPYRPDWKGAVERFFRTIHDRVRPEVPGFILPDYRKRGQPDYRLDATMTLKDFTQLVIGIILMHNEEVISSYECDAEMVADGLIPTPLELWNWGVKNRSGSLHIIPEDIVKLYLLPMDKALVTPKGIKFKKMYYSCEKALMEEWFDRARIKGNWSIDICFDYRNMTYIYIKDEHGRGYTICRMLERLDKYLGRSYEDILFLDELELTRLKGKSDQGLQNRLKRLKQSQKIIENALEKKAESSESDSKRVQGIRDNRQVEKERNREKEAFILADAQIQDIVSDSLNRPSSVQGAPTKHPRMLAILKQVQKGEK
ncbi:Mu transposase C-terminal domain-containing protein [Sporomusa sp. GT1]|uniref:Mu transposase C-terminal domain-containing protein n=1 Tax=Sporomusa sp. GT1 TaxID=1534747 RepID=UPI001CB81717|nr:Mu transposase C-terminal domain-containing protein [Sporomusa sp. GT1]